ncbi:MAG: hypothetical protein KGL39_02280 [Patescibacteria group bacterium]|nr:hypothetical protein [Patescibacteria group bacterium]
MLTKSNKERLEQEIANLIDLISTGRNFFFQKTGFNVRSSNNFLNHWKSKELFQAHLELRQLELNIQLLYIKLASYYQLISDKKVGNVKKQRNAFAHELTNLIFSKKVKYNFFLHKVTENFKRIQFVFYEENPVSGDGLVKTLDVDLDKDINDFILSWMKK